MSAEPVAADDLRTFLAALWQPGDVREVRIPKHDGRRTASGYFDDPELMATAVAPWDGRANLYLTLNPVEPALLARAAHRINASAGGTTADADIVERRWLLIDIDPARPAGISASAPENLAARDVARAVRSYLSGLGWPAPVVAMTGNGYALLHRIALPNDAASTELVVGVLDHLATRFDDDRVTIDRTVSNAARIGCLVGTLKVKGDATADRPHRRSAIVVLPARLEVVSTERLQALVPATGGHRTPDAGPGVATGWVGEWLDRAGVGYRTKPRGGDTWYRLDDCPFHPGEGAGDCGVGEAGDGKGMGHCFHNRGAGKGWHEFRDALRLDPPPAIRIIGTAPGANGSASDEPPWPNWREGTREAPPRGDATWPEPEDRGTATLSVLGGVEYVEDLIRPGRIVVWAAEEGSGKSYAVDSELGIRIAIAGGSFAGTWPVLEHGPVLVLSEMHPDDDYEREATTLASLGLDRAALAGRYYRLSLMTAAGGRPALTVDDWRTWVTGWLRDRRALLLIVDTATGATMVDPWGKAIQEVFANLRIMLDAYTALAVVLLLHLKKPQGHGAERRISDVLGEWGRWSDVVVIQENDGSSLERTKITVRKRVRHERRIVATKRGGLLVDPEDADAGSGPKVPIDDVLAVVAASPGLSYAQLGAALGVSKDTASNYVKAAGSRLRTVPTGPRRQILVYRTAEPPNTAEQARFGGASVVKPPEPERDRRTAEHLYIGSVVPSSVVTDQPTDDDSEPNRIQAEAVRVFSDDIEGPWPA
ncbi:MAG: AAA family ATPase [Candidatus Limnocylindrales bacterium]